MNNEIALETRTKGKFPISIATSLAVEGLFGVMDDKPEIKPQWKGVNNLLINARTLFRNLIGSIPKDNHVHLTPEDYAEGLIEEMEIIRNIVKDLSNGTIKTDYYVCTYNNLTGLYPRAIFKEAKSSNALFYAALENSTMDQVFIKLGAENPFIAKYDVSILNDVKVTLLVTHYPFDLLQVRKATRLGLLESHTGLVKGKLKWNTKLHDGKNLPRIPFDIMTIQLFGDSGGLFSPYPIDIRRKVIAVAEKYEWHTGTTRDRIMQCIQLAAKENHDPVLLTTVRSLYV